MTIRAIIKCQTMPELEAVLAFCKSIDLELDLAPSFGTKERDRERKRAQRATAKAGLNGAQVAEPYKFDRHGELRSNYMSSEEKRARKAQPFKFVDTGKPPRESHASLHAAAVSLAEKNGGQIERGALIAQLGKNRRLAARVVGQKVASWIAEGSLVAVK